MPSGRIQFVWLLLLGAIGLWSCQAQPTITPVPTQAIVTPDGTLEGEHILYFSTQSQDEAWYLMRPDGSEVRRIAWPSLMDYRIAGLRWVKELKVFTVSLLDAQGKEGLFLVDLSGNILRKLTSDIFPTGEAVYSSAARQFAFVCVEQDLDICVMAADGSNRVNLTLYPSRDAHPQWSPSGEQVVFVSNRNAVPGIWTVNTDGTRVTALSQVQFSEGNPSWAPDGSRIVFDSQRDFNWEIYIVNPDGQNSLNLTNNPADDTQPLWSPDGEHIAFVSTRDGGKDIFVMNSDGSGVVNVTNTPTGAETNFIWSADGQQILYVAPASGALDIFKVQADGSNRVNLTNRPGDDVDPQWISP